MKLLIVVGDTPSEPSMAPEGVRLLVDAASEVRVMSPSIVSRLHWLTGDVDRARRIADDRLATALDQLEDVGVDASATGGDELPLTAFADAMRQFPADHILMAVRGSEKDAWQRDGLVDDLLDRYAVPITVFAISAG